MESDIYVVSHAYDVTEGNSDLIGSKKNKVVNVVDVKPDIHGNTKVRFLTQYLGVSPSTNTLPSIMESIERMGKLYELIAPKKQ